MPNLGQGGCQAIEDGLVLSEELNSVQQRSEITRKLSTYRERRLVRSAAVQGLSRFASDIIIRGFDTPFKVVDGRFENFSYAGKTSTQHYQKSRMPRLRWKRQPNPCIFFSPLPLPRFTARYLILIVAPLAWSLGAGVVTRMLQPILPIFFAIQFNFLYDGWDNRKVIDLKAGVGLLFVGLLILLIAGGAIEVSEINDAAVTTFYCLCVAS